MGYKGEMMTIQQEIRRVYLDYIDWWQEFVDVYANHAKKGIKGLTLSELIELLKGTALFARLDAADRDKHSLRLFFLMNHRRWYRRQGTGELWEIWCEKELFGCKFRENYKKENWLI
jgi:hypothetical protein